ncbi:unnamed protein product [Heligmosomoides polygyrus]|uniref:Reverse transcriptase domain-containing protein n=1 Tax=Heligmosomoides polygyrus TaxID=6339 RepID=A0A3P8D4N1_HELPZ|nr:unnamed protein product [Heligmosomoides polygyrus]
MDLAARTMKDAVGKKGSASEFGCNYGKKDGEHVVVLEKPDVDCSITDALGDYDESDARRPEGSESEKDIMDLAARTMKDAVGKKGSASEFGCNYGKKDGEHVVVCVFLRVDGRQLHHLRFADDIVLITPSISQAEQMLADFDRVCGNVGLQLSLTKTMFSLNGTSISERSSYVYLSREDKMANDQVPELCRKKN